MSDFDYGPVVDHDVVAANKVYLTDYNPEELKRFLANIEGQYEEGANSNSAFEIEPLKAYQAKISHIELTNTKKGYRQVCFSFHGVDANGEKNGVIFRRWFLLPSYSPEIRAANDPEKLAGMTRTSNRNLGNFFAAAMPVEFAPKVKSVKEGDQWKNYDSQGNEITKQEFFRQKNAWDVTVAKHVAAIAQGLDIGLKGKLVWTVRMPHPTKPNEWLDTWYHMAPLQYEEYSPKKTGELLDEAIPF